MELVRTRQAVREALAPVRRSERTIGLVPTMGYLHDGHLSLLRAARERCDVVVMSLFVNPTQFRPGEDLADYPRDEARDAELAAGAGVDLLYAPTVAEVYPGDFTTSVIVEGLSEVLCGDPDRRGLEHFRGVTTVVAKLLNTVGPDVAFFGQKDAQQAIVIRRMVEDLDFPVEVVVLPTVREPDGLAMSSRNAYLGPDERRRAPAINQALERCRELLADGGAELDTALGAARRALAEAGIEPEYLEARDVEHLEPVAACNGRPVLIAVAAQLGDARLIDNILVHPHRKGA
jgi:pantoate--beta-alanine ligase